MVHVSLRAGLSKREVEQGPREAWLWRQSTLGCRAGVQLSIFACSRSYSPTLLCFFFCPGLDQGCPRSPGQGGCSTELSPLHLWGPLPCTHGMLHKCLTMKAERGGQPLPFLCHPLKQNVGEPHLSPTTTGCGYRNQGPLQAGLAGIPVPHPQPNPHQQWQWRRDKARRLRLGPGWKPAWNCQRRLRCQQGAEGKYSLPPGLGP